MMNQAAKPLTLLELNEFNKDLLRQAADLWNLENIRRALSMKESLTRTDDTYESDFLEPWVQWVSVHTGTPSSQHQIKHLGDVPHLSSRQLWEELSAKGVTSGVWGAMNASRNGAENCLFFLPDPWTFSEPGYPEELNRLLAMPRYIAKNYLNLDKLKIASMFFAFLKVIAQSGTFGVLIKELPSFIRNMRRFKGEHFVTIALTDYLLCELFLKYKRRFRPQFSLIFVNSLAHVQHHHWVNKDISSNERLKLCMQYMDRCIGRILEETKGENFLLFNGLSQKNTNEEKAWILYRQKDQGKFLDAIGIRPDKIEPHMTHDAHIFFVDAAACRKAKAVLENAQVNGQNLFLIESYNDDQTKLFYRIAFTDELPAGTNFKVNGETMDFFGHFEAIVKRTGKHIPVGNVFSSLEQLPERFYNHELYGLIVDHLSPRA